MSKKKPTVSAKPTRAGRPVTIDRKSIERVMKLLSKSGKTKAQAEQYLLSVGARRFLALHTYAEK
jgi:hypothetical protein